MIEFKLTTGMFDSQIYDEIRGKVSGESTRQVQEFLNPASKTHIYKPSPLHRVISHNEKYAIIHKSKSLWNQADSYFLTGINDEGLYFIHQIPHYDNFEDIENIVNGVNHYELGYERIQGDVLVKAIEIEKLSSVTMTKNVKKIFGGYETVTTEFPTYFRYDGGAEFRDMVESTFLVGMGNQDELGSNRMFRNHSVEVINGKGYAGNFRQAFCILGEKVIIKHPEHKTTELIIPKGHFLHFIQQKTVNYNHD